MGCKNATETQRRAPDTQGGHNTKMTRVWNRERSIAGYARRCVAHALEVSKLPQSPFLGKVREKQA